MSELTGMSRTTITKAVAELTRVRDLIRDICGQHEGKIMKGHVAKDHVHLFISIPPQVTISRLLQWLKGKTAHQLLAEFAHLKKQFWGRHLWAEDTSAAVRVTSPTM
jgi:putative transposase